MNGMNAAILCMAALRYVIIRYILLRALPGGLVTSGTCMQVKEDEKPVS